MPVNWPLQLSRGAVGAAAAAGSLLGYDFGQQIGGLWLSLLLALNTGVFFALVMGMLADRWVPSDRLPTVPEKTRARQDPARVDQQGG